MEKQITKPVAANKKPIAVRTATKPAPAPVAVKAAVKPAVTAKPPVAAKPTVAPVAKAAVKPAGAVRPVAQQKASVRNLFILTDIARPQSQSRLFAHTMAAMSVLGMFAKGRPAVLRAALQAFVGATAISYHTKKKGTLVEEGDRIRLTEFGAGFFPARNFDKAEQAGFETLFKTGDGSAVRVRSQHIVPVSLAV